MDEHDLCCGKEANVECCQCGECCCEDCAGTYEMVVTYIDPYDGEETSVLGTHTICDFCDPQFEADRKMEHEETIAVQWEWV